MARNKRRFDNLTLSSKKSPDLKLSVFRKMVFKKIGSDRIKLLDIGCYTSELHDFLPHKRVEYHGIDLDAEGSIISRKKGVITHKADVDLTGLSGITDKFDVIVASEILEHLKYPVTLIEEIRRLLKPNGRVLIALPNENTIINRILFFFGRGVDAEAFSQRGKHLHFPTIQQSRDFLDQFFRIEQVDYWSSGGGRFQKILPTSQLFYKILCRISPTLFARGVIFWARHKRYISSSND